MTPLFDLFIDNGAETPTFQMRAPRQVILDIIALPGAAGRVEQETALGGDVLLHKNGRVWMMRHAAGPLGTEC